jgi:amino acid transporter
MAQAKKFGTFGGVFTPSILTILGVIMYMRLPWIVGQAGLFLTVGIILVAHIVSISTGLSVSSIATDKKVKAGGTYYIISRSLGLPIGGTLGVALFFGLSMSVSLYIIGFSESFLGFWGMAITKDTIRLTGTIALLMVGTLTFISTSLAIKTQYFIMTAIGLSLVTILFGSSQYVPAEPLLNPIETMSPIILLFAIFFPAVTGFEAGVSMSGDLQDPKKSIPLGTIAAILLGLIVYIGLAAFFAFRVNSDQLVNNPNVLLDLSFFPPLLVAGIWGATMSSAIGSILGAPRILQATSVDRITPNIFAKGYGKTNEPRNALILTFIIAEAGILIGELNIIARVVSMFFITTYGFLNLSSSLEKWASTDFRPSFKIPTAISVIGALVCFTLMLELDFVALIGATIIMAGIFLYLKRKELTLESGDTWEGVWSSVLRSGLNRLSRTVKQQRNWRPNIILFSGGGSARPHLIELGRWLVHKRGILSNFNLIENKNPKQLIPKIVQSEPVDTDKFQGMFTRHMEVNDVYTGMEIITKVYGFAGIEPNSVMLGWARNTKKPQEFAELIKSFNQMDYNVFILDYDKERGFGSKKTIDLWWRGGSNNFTLGLTLLKFLQMSEDWEESTARILIINDDSTLTNKIYKNANLVLEEQRVQAELKIINNAIERNPVYEIIKRESLESDLVILGIPEIKDEKVANFISSTDQIIASLGSLLLIDASSFFKPIFIGIEKIKEVIKPELNSPSVSAAMPPVQLPDNDVLAEAVRNMDIQLNEALKSYSTNGLDLFHGVNLSLINKFEKLLDRNFRETEELLTTKETHRHRKILSRVQSNFLFQARRIIQEYKDSLLIEQKECLDTGIKNFLADIKSFKDNTPAELVAVFEKPETGTPTGKRSIWTKLHLSRGNKPIRRKFKLHSLFNVTLRQIEQNLIFKNIEEAGLRSYRLLSDLQNLYTSVADSFHIIESALNKGTPIDNVIKAERQTLENKLQTIIENLKNDYHKSGNDLRLGVRNSLQTMSKLFDKQNINRLVKRKYKKLKKQPDPEIIIRETPEAWNHNQELISSFFIEDLFIKQFQNRVETILERFVDELQLSLNTNYSDPLNELLDMMESVKTGKIQQISWSNASQGPIDSTDIFNNLLNDIQAANEDLPENLEIMTEESFQNLEQEQFGDISSHTVNLKRHAEFIIETELIDALQREIFEIPPQLQRSMDVALDVVRFTNYNLEFVPNADSGIVSDLAGIIKNGSDRIKKESETIAEIGLSLQNKSKKLLNSCFEKMNPYLISRSAGELKHTIRTQESLKLLERMSRYRHAVVNWVNNLLVRAIYQKSEGLLFAKKISKASGIYQTQTSKVLEIIMAVSPDSEVIRALPFYYQQLFLGKRILGKEFLILRPKEMEQAAFIIDTYRQGYKGALLVKGDRLSGKSTISRMIAEKYFKPDKIYQLFAPEGGTIDKGVFLQKLNHVLGESNTTQLIYQSIPQDSVFIIHDLELWWERSIEGFGVLQMIIDLIDKYSSQCLFIINSTNNAYQFIDQVHSIENLFIGTIDCLAFDSEEIEEAILLRHRSSGLKFELDEQMEDTISNLRRAKLFNKYFDISNGNIGQAMICWISNIVKVKPQIVQIRQAENYPIHALDELDQNWLLILQQFSLHKQLTPARLEMILAWGKTSIEKELTLLKRSGLISEIQKDVLEMNPYLLPLINKKLLEANLI